MDPRLFSIVLLVVQPCAFCQVVVYEGTSFPEEQGWTPNPFCDPPRWLYSGVFFQHVESCPDFPPPGGQQESFTRDLDAFIDSDTFFLEWRMQTTGDQSEIPWTAPAAMVAGSFGPANYHFTIARDRVRFIRDNLLPIVWIDIAPGVSHRYRLELYRGDLYVCFIDGEVVDSGLPEAVFPSFTPVLAFRAKSWLLESTTMWDYVRYGVPGVEHSGDYDSSSTVELFDFFYFQECVAERGNGPGIPIDPGCEFADMDADGDVDFQDFGLFQRLFTGSE